MVDEASEVRVDVGFPVIGERIPVDHGYALFGAICRELGDLHGAKWLAVHPMGGLVRPDNMLSLSSRADRGMLRLRVVASRIPDVLPLAGKTIVIDGWSLRLGVPNCYALQPSPSLFSRLVVIKGFVDPEPFAAAVARQLDALEVVGRVELGRRRIVTIGGKRVVGFGITIHDLSNAHSLMLQYEGIGGRRRMGCGVFVPARGDG